MTPSPMYHGVVVDAKGDPLGFDYSAMVAFLNARDCNVTEHDVRQWTFDARYKLVQLMLANASVSTRDTYKPYAETGCDVSETFSEW